VSDTRSRAKYAPQLTPARGRVACTIVNTSVGDHVIYGGPISDFECTVESIIGDVAMCKAVRSDTEFPAAISKLSFVEREAT